MTQHERTLRTMMGVAGILAALTLATGCKSFAIWPTGKNENDRIQFAAANEPSRKHEPRSVESLIPVIDTGQIAAAPLESESNSMGHGIDLDDVLLPQQQVHVEAESDLEEIAAQDADQLPDFLESAAHPYGSITPPLVSPESFSTGAGTAEQSRTPSVSGPQPIPTAPESADHQTAGFVEPAESASGASMIKLVVESPLPDEQPKISHELDSMLAQRQSVSPPRSDGAVSMTIGDQSPPAEPQRSTDVPAPPPESPQTAEVTAGPAPEQVQTVVQQDTPDQTNPNAASIPPEAIPESSPQTAPSPRQLTWREQLQDSIQLLDKQLTEADSGNDTAQSQIRRHLLHLVAGTDGGSLEIDGLSPTELNYWQEQMASIQVMLNGLPDEDSAAASHLIRRRRATAAAEHLDRAANQLARQATLKIENAAFCTQVQGFGQFTRASGQFGPGEPSLIYCEIRNYDLRPVAAVGNQPAQFVAELRGQFAVIDDQDQVVHQHQFQSVEDTTRFRRKDFYMYFPVTIPQLPAGHYRLQLSVEDMIGNKFASIESDLEFHVFDQPRPGRSPRTAGSRPPGGNDRQATRRQ